MTADAHAFVAQHNIAEIECLVPDINGVLRGKVLPADAFLEALNQDGLRIPSSIHAVTITGEYPDDEDLVPTVDPDVMLRPDLATLRRAPGFDTPTAFVFADSFYRDGRPFEVAPRHVLKKVVDLYAARGWKPVVAPELEFYLTRINANPDLPLEPPPGRSGRPESAPQPFGLESMSEYETLIEAIYDDCEAASLDIGTMIHELGAAQLEINFDHGDPVALADQVIIFKRLVRQAALRHGVYATFMAKPMQDQPGSAMHVHMSVVDAASGINIFADGAGGNTGRFMGFAGGLQKLLPEIAPLFAPNVNSFRRMRPNHAAPINVQWGYDNRTCGLRVPFSAGANRRIENRLPGADANPYLAIAAGLVAGYIGMVEDMTPAAMVEDSAWERGRSLPRTLAEALSRFDACEPVNAALGRRFCRTFIAVKEKELDAYEMRVSAWERDHLLLKV